jgi:hypothetical protein
MISNSNRSGAIATVPETREQRRESDIRSGGAQDHSGSQPSGTLNVQPDTRIEVRDGRLLLVQKSND